MDDTSALRPADVAAATPPDTTAPTAPPPASAAHGTSRRPARGGVRDAERSLAPDLARGTMLLMIVLSNTVFHLWDARHGPSGWHPDEGSVLDRVTQFLLITVVDLRVNPLFAFLFGYGMTQLLLRQRAAGSSERAAAGLLRRRGLWLVAFGFAHAALLLGGDIIGFYGVVCLLIGGLFLRRSDRTVLIAAGVAAGLSIALMTPGLVAVASGDLGALGSTGGDPSSDAYASGEESVLAAAGTRLLTWSFITSLGPVLSFASHAAVLLGFWAARRRVLEEPHRHRALLGWTAAVGLTISLAGSLPSALAHVGALDVPGEAVSEEGALRLVLDGTGLAGGLGYVALFGLLADRLARRPRHGRVMRAVRAVGKRSLSCYLGHSLVFAPLLAAWGLGLGAGLGSAGMAAFAVGVWLLSAVVAYGLERAGRRGPAEAALRRLTYGRAADASRR
ncbi:DUF418 domain-containing protein [Streptomyces sp. 71268]|uniref:DUF418 domain-containing protein n=1 Tax=Streptomyces sp. 71268 TaxID=3002640 RepID=UPI0023F95665|nr:DUF418 domain-containing protein [Streptomyces sp. 71268]WEV29381.1 DUF418 domain-containing protein [Streptomyces sp. 71268]